MPATYTHVPTSFANLTFADLINLVHVEAGDLDTYDYDKLNDRDPVLTDRHGFMVSC